MTPILTILLAVASQQCTESPRCYWCPASEEFPRNELLVVVEYKTPTPREWALSALRSIIDGPQDEHTLRLYGAMTIMASTKQARAER